MKLPVDRLIEGLLILKRVEPDLDLSIAMGQVFAGSIQEFPKEDLALLEALGWAWNEFYECWGLYL